MQIIKYPEKFKWQEIIRRPALEQTGLEQTVREVLNQVKLKGDSAIREYTARFDGVALDTNVVNEKEIQQAEQSLTPELKEAIQLAAKNIRLFHQAQLSEVVKIETMPGVECWRRSVPVEKVGLYIPGGTAPLFSTILMLGIPAQLAGCREIILCSPPAKDGSLHPAILYTASLVGVTKIFKAGGVQAIAAMAYGTETIPAVYKIFGPGNQYVTAAKTMVQQEGLAIDMPAGPSEVCVLADDSANPAFIAADLLSQAEHGKDSQVLLVSDNEEVVNATIRELNIQLEKLGRKELASGALQHSKAVVVRSLDEGIELINEYAAEHLIIACRDEYHIAEKITSAGSVFLGNYSPESAGDYASGTNHTLPTNGYARAYSGVSVDSFVKKITYQKLSREGLGKLGKAVVEMAEAEGLQAHAEAVRIRLK